MKTWYTIENLKKDDDGDYDEVNVFDEIGAFGVSARDFAESMKSIPQDRRIIVGINSPGGSVFDGLAIYNLLNQRKSHVTTRVDGLAASIASVIAMAGSKVVMPENAMMMIHDPTGVVIGDSEDMRKMGETLDKIRDQIASVYIKKTGKEAADIKKTMADETWFTANEAKEYGLCDCVQDAVNINNTFDLRLFRNAPGVAVARNNTTGNTPNKKNTMEKLLAALVEAKLIPSAKLEDGEAAELFKATFKELKEAIDNLQTEITSLREEQKTQKKKQAEAFINDAVKARKIKDDPALKNRWVAAYQADEEGTRAMIDGMETVVHRGSAPIPPEDRTTDKEAQIRELQDKLKGADWQTRLTSQNPEVRNAAIKERSEISRQLRELRGDKEMFAGKTQ